MYSLLLFLQVNESELTAGQYFLVVFLFLLMAAIVLGFGIFVGIKAFKSEKPKK